MSVSTSKWCKISYICELINAWEFQSHFVASYSSLNPFCSLQKFYLSARTSFMCLQSQKLQYQNCSSGTTSLCVVMPFMLKITERCLKCFFFYSLTWSWDCGPLRHTGTTCAIDRCLCGAVCQQSCGKRITRNLSEEAGPVWWSIYSNAGWIWRNALDCGVLYTLMLWPQMSCLIPTF